MSRNQELLNRLRDVNPVPGTERTLPAAAPVRRGRSRLVFGVSAVGVAVVALLAVVALNPGEDSDGVIAAAAATAADQPPIEIGPDQFAYRTEDWYQPSIPGDVKEATPERLAVDGSDQDPAPRNGTREVWFSPRNRGSVTGDESGEWPGCTAADYVIAYAIDDYCWKAFGGPVGTGNYLFEAPPGIQRMVEQSTDREGPRYWEFSPAIATLGTDPEKIDAAVTDLGKQLENGQATLNTLGNESAKIFLNPTEPDDSAFKLRAVADLLANPLAPPDVRAALFQYAGGIAGVESSSDATDPQGREGASISIMSTPADPDPVIVTGLPDQIAEDSFGQYKAGGYRIDLSDLTLRTEIVFDPETSELLSERVELVAADDPLLGPWLEREDAPQTVYSRTFEPVTVVSSDRKRPDDG